MRSFMRTLTEVEKEEKDARNKADLEALKARS